MTKVMKEQKNQSNKWEKNPVFDFRLCVAHRGPHLNRFRFFLFAKYDNTANRLKLDFPQFVIFSAWLLYWKGHSQTSYSCSHGNKWNRSKTKLIYGFYVTEKIEAEWLYEWKQLQSRNNSSSTRWTPGNTGPEKRCSYNTVIKESFNIRT